MMLFCDKAKAYFFICFALLFLIGPSLCYFTEMNLGVNLKISKNILITGANRGVGFGICRKILSDYDDCGVILGARSKESGHRALEQLRTENQSWNNRLKVLELDVSDEESVLSAATVLTDQEMTLNAIVNNAGIALDVPWAPKPFTAEVARKTLNTNFWGILRVCRHFSPLLEKDRGRIINITSGAGQMNMQKMSDKRRAEVLREDLTMNELEMLAENFISTYEQQADVLELPQQFDGWWLQAYGFSKACVNMMTRIQARENPLLQVNCCTPGFVATDMVAGYSGESQLKSIDEGADTPVWLCLGEVDGSGLLFGNERKQLPHSAEYN